MAFPKKTPAEVKLATFMFNTEMPENTTLQSAAAVAIDLSTQEDVTSDLIADGSMVILDMIDDDGAPIAGREAQWVAFFLQGGEDGHKYRISVLAEASNGERHQIDKDLPVSLAGAVVK